MAVPPRDRGRRYRMEAGIGWPREGRHHKDKERFLGAFGTSKWRVGKRIGRGKISGDYRLMGRRGGTRARCARSGWRWSGRYRKMPTSRQWSARGSGRAGPSTALRTGPSTTLRTGGMTMPRRIVSYAAWALAARAGPPRRAGSADLWSKSRSACSQSCNSSPGAPRRSR